MDPLSSDYEEEIENQANLGEPSVQQHLQLAKSEIMIFREYRVHSFPFYGNKR
jgi:hypothetical protein